MYDDMFNAYKRTFDKIDYEAMFDDLQVKKQIEQIVVDVIENKTTLAINKDAICDALEKAIRAL